MGELFEVLTSKKRFDANKVQVFEEGKNPYVVRTSSNNGQRGFIDEDELYLNDGNTISFGQDTATMFYQEKPYFTGDKIKILKAKNKKFNKNNSQFFISTMAKAFSAFSWGSSSFNVSIIENQKLTLPTQNGEIDFAFMENFIAELEAERIAELEAYLRVTGLSDYILTEEERAVLEAFRNGKISWGGVKLLNNQQVANIEWKMFRIGELFEINSYKKRFDANKVQIEEVGFPYVVRTALNNGIRGYINEDVEFLNEGNTISFGQDTATMFYQEKPYFTGDKIKIVKCKDESFNKLNAHFFIAAMGKAFSSFSWGSSSFSVEIIKNQNISLPSTQGVPLYAYMEVFIRAVQKLVIKEVVQYADRKITATREVVTKT